MADYLVQGASITAVADAIREKGGTTAPLSFPAGMAEAVRNIQSGGAFIFQAVEICSISVSTYYKEES